jgi:hypothetical protein
VSSVVQVLELVTTEDTGYTEDIYCAPKRSRKVLIS